MMGIPRPIPNLGLYPYTYAVEDIAGSNELTEVGKADLSSEMARAIRKGELQVRVESTGAPSPVTQNMENPSPYVRISDINNWLGKKDYPYKWTPSSQPATPHAANGIVKPKLQIQQEDNILHIIRDVLKLDPLNLPARKNGKAGAKSSVRNKLGIPCPLFNTVTVFNKAWERLRGKGCIKGGETLPHQTGG